MQNYRIFIKLTLLLLQLAVWVNADCDICVATYDLRNCSHPQFCSALAFVCHDSQNIQASCSGAEYLPLLIQSQSGPECAESTTTTTTVAPSTTTTPAAPRTPNAICAAERRPDVFPPDNDTTCLEYLICYQLGNEWRALIKRCSTGQYFDKFGKVCTQTKPEYCK